MQAAERLLEIRDKFGWDNAPHHTRVVSFPHHRHVEKQSNVRPSYETSLKQVMEIVLSES